MKHCVRLFRSLYVTSTSKQLTASFHTKVWTPLNINIFRASFANPHIAFARRRVESLSFPTDERSTDASYVVSEEEEDTLRHPDYFGIKDLVTVEDLFNARVHYGHKKGSRNEHMKPYFFGCRLDVDIFDLDVTLEHMHRALNMLAHIAYRKGIILFIMKSHKFGHLVEQLAMDCGEYAHTRDWRIGSFTDASAQNYGDRATLRLPDVCVFLSTQGAPYQSHLAVNESAKVGILSIGVCDSNVNPTIISYPIPGNDDSLQSIELYCRLFKEAVMRGKESRLQADRKKEQKKLAISEQNDNSLNSSLLDEIS